MGKKFKRSYKFAFKSAWIITASSLFVLIPIFVLVADVKWYAYLAYVIWTFVCSFFIIQYRAEQFIYKRVKSIYDDVSLIEPSTLKGNPITTDMETLTKQVQKFATYKKTEIESLEEREAYRREFLGNISHELKTPLFTVQSYLSTLIDGAMDDQEVRVKYLERAEKGVERLIYIVKDLDMISKLETGTLHLNYNEFDIVKTVQTIFDLLEFRAEKKQISLMFDMKYDQPIWVHADEDRILQLITNLVENSIKYGKQKGTTEVSIESFVNNKVIIRITDNGEGIKKEYIARLFERFFRIDKSGSRAVGGSGLGLSIVKHIVEAHKEHIYVESRFGFGSEFSFTLEKSDKKGA